MNTSREMETRLLYTVCLVSRIGRAVCNWFRAYHEAYYTELRDRERHVSTLSY